MTDRRFPPSIARLKKARNQGKVVKSHIVTMLSGWLSGALFLYLTLPWVRSGTLIHWLKFKVLNPEGAFIHALVVASGVLTLFISVVAVGCVFIGSVQTRGLLVLGQVLPDIKRLQPTRYLTRIRECSAEALLGVARVAILLLVVSPIIIEYVFNAPILVWAPGGWTVPIVSRSLEAMFGRSFLVCFVYAVLAYWCVRWRYLREHRMSHEELREEYKESEGDPHRRAAQRHEHQAMAMAEIERRVRRSKVIIIRKRPEESG
jgi:flagellar biosynthesis protein FlhB